MSSSDAVRDRAIAAAEQIRATRFVDAAAVFAAGSLIRGEGTTSSDLDLVVIFAALPTAYRESFRFGALPVEAFVHDPETLEYFFAEVDRPSGIPALPQMVLEGVEITRPSDLSKALKHRALELLTAGPPPLDVETEMSWRYSVTDLLDDLRGARLGAERVAIGAVLHGELANLYLRHHRKWTGRGKGLHRALRIADPVLCERYSGAFASLFTKGDIQPVVDVAEGMLNKCGGLLFDGYRREAPAAWRKRFA